MRRQRVPQTLLKHRELRSRQMSLVGEAQVLSDQVDSYPIGLGLTGDLQLRPAGLSRGPIQQAEAHSLAGRFVPIVSVCDGEPGLLDNAGSFLGVPQRALGVTAFSKSGTPQDVYRYHHLDAKSIQDAAHSILEQTAARNVQLFTH